jgi:hypothetical protein
MVSVSTKECISNFVEALHEKNAAIFAGAGFSVPAGFVNWKELMRDIANDLGLDVDIETDMIAIAQYHINSRLGNRSIINQAIINHFTKSATPTLNHTILAQLPITSYWTTNYDELIETSLKDAGKTPDVKRISQNMCISIPKRDAVVYKMHGDVSLPNDAVLTREDYETYENNRGAYSIVLQSELFSKTFLFVGFSFEDPNLVYILTRIKNLLGTKVIKTHYCFFKRENDADKLRKQELKLIDLNRYGINAVLINEYDEITHILDRIRTLFKRSQIFISGAAESFSDFAEDDVSKEFIHNLSKELVSSGRRIISGYGFNVGSVVINGALEFIFSTKYRKLDEYLKLMPFPQFTGGALTGLSPAEIQLKKKERNNKYRDLMLSEAGIAVFIFGNKKDTNPATPIKNSNGMYEEYQIAISKGIKPIPIGATGYMAKEIWTEVMANFSSHYGTDAEIKSWLTLLGDNSVSHDELINCVIKIINKLNKIES